MTNDIDKTAIDWAKEWIVATGYGKIYPELLTVINRIMVASEKRGMLNASDIARFCSPKNVHDCGQLVAAEQIRTAADNLGKEGKCPPR